MSAIDGGTGVDGETSVAGVVAAFDEHVGLGEVEGAGGRHPFHCTSIAGGTRTIAVGTPVTYRLRPAHRGRWEAVDVTPRPG